MTRFTALKICALRHKRRLEALEMLNPVSQKTHAMYITAPDLGIWDSRS
jgi:hypothetical protein